MQRYFNSVITRSGSAVQSASVLVKDYPAGTTATIYSDNGVTGASNPVSTDANGQFGFYAADGRYSLVISKTGVITQQTIDDIPLLDDPAEGTLSSAIVTFLQSGIATSAHRAARTVNAKASEIVTVDDALNSSGTAVQGDGVTIDTTGIQRALDGGAKIVRGVPGKTYLVDFTGTKTINGTAYRYCLLIPDGVFFDLNGATLKLANSQNAALVLNATAGTTQNTDLGIGNGIIDGNQTNQTLPATGEMACVHLYDVLRPKVYDLRVKNVREYAGRFMKIDGGYFDNLHCEDSNGDGWSFGTAANSQHVTYSFIDNIYCEAATGVFGSLEGNGFICTVKFCHIGKVTTVNCAGGNKLQDTSNDSTWEASIFEGGANSSSNSGTKIQGNGAGLTPTRISVGRIVSNAANGYGAYLYDNQDVQIGSITSYGDAIAGTGAAVYIDSTAIDMKIGSMSVEESGQVGIDCRGVNLHIGSATVKNSAHVTAGVANFSIGAAADGVHIGSLVSADDQGTPTAQRGLNLQSGAKNITIDDYRSLGVYTNAALHLVDNGATNVRIGKFTVVDNPTYAPIVTISTVGNVGGGEDDLVSATVALNSLYKNGAGYRITAWGLTGNNTNPKTIKLYFGSAAIETFALTVSQVNIWRIEATVVRTAGNAQAYTSRLTQEGTADASDLEQGTSAETDTSNITVKCTGTVTDGGGGINNNDIQQLGLILEPIG